MSTFSTLRALHSLIGNALDEIEHVYQSRGGQDGPLDYPSLDQPFYKNGPAKSEETVAEKLTTEPQVVEATNRAVAACGQLAASLQRPFFQLIDGIMSDHVASCIMFLEESHTVEILRAAGDKGMHVRDIARAIDDVRKIDETGADPLDPAKLSHILRLLATYHWLREVKPDVFANNRLSAQVDSGKTPEQLKNAPHEKHDDTDGVPALVAMTGDDFLKAFSFLSDQLLPTRERAVTLHSLLGGDSKVNKPIKAYKAPFNLAFRTELGYFDWLELPQNKTRLTEFGRAMTGARGWEVSENIVNAYPWKNLADNSVVIDVGGGIGSTSMVLAKAYPNLRFVVEDRPHVVEIAPTVWGASHKELLDSGRVSFKAQSFFDPQPPKIEVPGVGAIAAPAVYLIRGCTHNWPDADVVKMLRHLRNAAAPTTQLLIVDMLLPLACVDDTEVDEPIPGAVRSLAPEGSPLLANLGKASANGYLLDLSMMAQLNAKERTLWEIAALAREAGWKVTGTTRAAGSLWAYTSAKPV
ncbi:S-adenosyl-L-methionine-dependent methyltransferase [Trametes sanguinea]|nr:S-adenosyl-L-methionine-dependent methyltransferase [Trametes sanguinea]